MSFAVAVRSAVFYLLACTPCANARHHHRTRARTRKERAEKERTTNQQPDAYRHPSPYNTNPYWGEEIRNGPAPAKSSSCGRLGSSGKDSVVSDLPSANLDSRSTIVASPTPLDRTQNPTTTADDGEQHQHQQQGGDAAGAGAGFGYRPVQRLLVSAISKASSSAGRFVENTLGLPPPVTHEDRHNFYSGHHHHKNPPVNDLHPPIVSTKVPHPVAHKWMLEPPPPAGVMEGKVPMRHTSLTASTSRSRPRRPAPTTDDPPPFDRILLVKHLEESARLARGPTEEELINQLIGLPMPIMTLARRSRSLSIESLSSSGLAPPYSDSECMSRPRRPSHASSRESLPATPLDAPMHAAQRPKLQTIMSSRIGSLPKEP